MQRLTAALVVVVLLLAACGAADDAPESTTTVAAAPSTTQAATTTSPEDPTTTTTSSSTTTSTTTSTSTTTTTTQAPDPGSPIEGPAAGDVLGVVGVAASDVLNVRELPGVEAGIIDTLAPTEMNIVAVGNSRIVAQSIWHEIELDANTGWANARFLAYIGETTDITFAIAEFFDGELPTAATMEELAEDIAETQASDDPASTIVIVDGPSAGDLHEVTVDVIGLGDDSVGGLRLHIFAEETAAGFTLDAAERTLLCSRGVTTEGVCV